MVGMNWQGVIESRILCERTDHREYGCIPQNSDLLSLGIDLVGLNTTRIKFSTIIARSSYDPGYSTARERLAGKARSTRYLCCF